MWKDEVVEEVRRIREAYAKRFDYDLKRIFEDLKKKEQTHPGRLAVPSPSRGQRDRG